MRGLEVFTPLVHQVTIDGTTVVVGPFRARQFSEIHAALAPLWPALLPTVKGPDGAAKVVPNFEAAVAGNYPDVRRALCAATGVAPEWVDRQDPFDVIGLLALVVDANADFSRRRIVPALNGLAETMARAIGPVGGATPSPASPPSSEGSTPPST